MIRSPSGLASLLGRLLVLLAGAWALQVQAAPDAALGRSKAQLCFACHGEQGIAVQPAVPHLAAQPALSLFYQMVQFRNQQRKGGGMETLVAGLSDADMRDIAAWFASQRPPPGQGGAQAERVARGQALSQQQFCSSCHGARLQGQKHVPRLAGQAQDYFLTQLRNIRSGARVDMDGTMGSAARGLSDEDIEALAAYAASLD